MKENKEFKIFRCEICGNIIVKIEDSGVVPTCCGQPMTELVPGMEDGVIEKHVPVFTLDGSTVTVKVGSVLHPSTADHFIMWILVKTDLGIYVRYLLPGDEPSAVFRLDPDEKLESVYEYCNIHRLWANLP